MLVSILLIYQIYQMYYYVENTNRKLTRFLEYVKYSDFASGFSSDNHLGSSFQELNDAFNEVLEAFRQARSEKEEHLKYLNTVVQHVGIGLLSFDQDGKIELINTAASRLLYITNILNIRELSEMHAELTELLLNLKPGGSALYRSTNQQLAVHATEIRLRGKSYKLLSLQNIQNELQQKELEAWQNLTSVLRHEIMNSITPITSLIGTVNEIFEEELPDFEEQQEAVTLKTEVVTDIHDALLTIERRSRGLITFVNAYKEFTHIPKPKFKVFPLAEILENIAQLMQEDIKQKHIQLLLFIKDPHIQLTADPELIEMVLINLVKNAAQAVEGRKNGRVELIGGLDDLQHPIVVVADNGPGIIPEAIDQIFIPFYTTKKEGSGIGLSLSRQIMQLHRGTLSVSSLPNERTEFMLRF